MLTDDDLKAMRERCEKATAGPWQFHRHHRGYCYQVNEPAGFDDAIWGANPIPEDARFIAAARTDIPRLLDEIDRLRAVAEAAEQWDRWEGKWARVDEALKRWKEHKA